jgi:hypothetical protein
VKLTIAVLILGASSTVFAQSPERVIRDRHKLFASWLGIVRTAESQYSHKHGVYGNLAASRDGQLLRELVFASDTSQEDASNQNLVPTTTDFQVTVSRHGRHYQVAIRETLVDVGRVSLLATENSTEWMVPAQTRDLEDGPEGPLPSVAR